MEGIRKREAYEYGFRLNDVREDYVIRDDRLWPQGEIKCRYAPMLCEELPGEIAKLTWGDNNAVLRFARRYGLLGYWYVLKGEIALVRDVNPAPDEEGEPLQWIWMHANTINVCLHLTNLLQEGNETPLQSYLSMLRSPLSLGVDYGPPLDACVEGLKDGCCIPIPEWRITENAQMVRNTLVNTNISPVRRRIFGVYGKGDKSCFSVMGTIRAAYWHLATLIETGNYRIVRCKDPKCQAWFAQKDPRQHFCPAQAGMKESRCSARYRMRARRADQREQREN